MQNDTAVSDEKSGNADCAELINEFKIFVIKPYLD